MCLEQLGVVGCACFSCSVTGMHQSSLLNLSSISHNPNMFRNQYTGQSNGDVYALNQLQGLRNINFKEAILKEQREILAFAQARERWLRDRDMALMYKSQFIDDVFDGQVKDG